MKELTATLARFRGQLIEAGLTPHLKMGSPEGDGLPAQDTSAIVAALDEGPQWIKGEGYRVAVAHSRSKLMEFLGQARDITLEPSPSPVNGRVAVVTGGAQGFGAEIAVELAHRGALLAIADINLSGAQSMCERLNGLGFGNIAHFIVVDVSDEASVEGMVAEVVEQFGGIDLFVSNAGVLRAGSVLDMEKADFDLVTKINYSAFFLCTKHAGQVMVETHSTAPNHRADIVEVNSKSGLAGSNRNGAYAGSKFGGLGLVQSFAMELVEHGIKVNAVCPGNFFEGPLWMDPDRGLFVQYLNAGKVAGAKTIDDVRRFYEDKVPMKRGCLPADVAKAIVYLVDQAYETGQALPVTGGQIMLN